MFTFLDELYTVTSLKSWVSTFIYSNVIIALAAVAQCALTYLIIDQPLNLYILLIEGTSTLILYNFSLYLSRPSSPENSPFARTRWFFTHRKWMDFNTFFAVVMLLYAVFHIHLHTLFYLGFIGVLSLAYNRPFLWFGKNKKGIRQVAGLKLFYIALLWSLSTVGLPIVEGNAHWISIDRHGISYLFVLRFLFILICTLPFDIRDMAQDTHYGLKTIPILVGKRKSIQLNYVFLFIHTTLVVLGSYPSAIKTAFIMVNILTFILLYGLVFQKKQLNHDTVYVMDVLLILQYTIIAVNYS